MLSAIASYVLVTHLAAGGLAALALIRRDWVPASYFRYGVSAGLVLIAIALLLRPAAAAAWAEEGVVHEAAPASTSLWLLAASGAVAVAHLVAIARGARATRPLLALAALLGAAAVAADALRYAPPGGGALAHALPVVGALTAGLLSGSVLCTMVLGHWYLVPPPISFDPLERMAKAVLAAVVLRCAAIGWAALADGAAVATLWDDRALFLAMRIGAGLAAPLLLAVMVIACVRLRSNMSATGLLYVMTILVLMGEVAAMNLVLDSGMPL